MYMITYNEIQILSLVILNVYIIIYVIINAFINNINPYYYDHIFKIELNISHNFHRLTIEMNISVTYIEQ